MAQPTDVLIDDAVEKVQSTVSRSIVTKLVPFLTLALVPVTAWLQAKVGIDLSPTELAVYIGTAILGIAGVAATYVRGRLHGIYTLHRLVQLSLPKIAETVLSVVIATAAPLLVALLFLRFPLFNTTLGFLFLGGVISLGYLYTMYLTYRFAKKGPYPTLRIIGMSFVDRFKMRFSFLR
jgi:uncharacterized membrane protein